MEARRPGSGHAAQGEPRGRDALEPGEPAAEGRVGSPEPRSDHVEPLLERVAGEPRLRELRSSVPGPTVVIVGGIHGNEPAGLVGAARVFAHLEASGAWRRGRLAVVAGNRAALREGRRYLSRDLNRGWSERALVELAAREPSDHEDHEQRELAEVLDRLIAERRGPVVLLDLHTTSAPSPPFVCFGDTLRNRALGLALGLPAILGLEEAIPGTMQSVYTERGHTCVAVEAGQHEAPTTAPLHESVVWLALVAAGALDEASVPALEVHRARVHAASGSAPRVLEIWHRHLVRDGDGFEMLPGHAGFDRVRRGQAIARDARGAITVDRDSVLLMPRYQPQGDDGFFLAREVAPFWLGVSTAARRARLDRLLELMPGVTRDPDDARVLLVDHALARVAVDDVMHLCGYRKLEPRGERSAYRRRRP